MSPCSAVPGPARSHSCAMAAEVVAVDATTEVVVEITEAEEIVTITK